jgi:hypothetical protein
MDEPRFDLSDQDAVAFCPSCGAGYLAGVTRCDDCGLQLEARSVIEARVARDRSKAEETGGMKIVYSTQRPLVAQMLTHTLQEHEIPARVEGQEANQKLAQPVTIWVPEEHYTEAQRIISHIEDSPTEPEPESEIVREAERMPPTPVGSTPSGFRFYVGLLLGALLGYGYFAYQDRSASKEGVPRNTDRNRDGAQDFWEKRSLVDNQPIFIYDSDFDGTADRWIYYENGVLAREEYDRNKDEKPDGWIYYNDVEQIVRSEEDDDFNGEPDHWTEYENGEAREFTGDLDFDGRIDEWGSFRNGLLKERKVSFRNDGVADKRIVYGRNRRVRVEYDRDRDGTFEEVMNLDPFEEVRNVAEGENRPE